MDPIIIYISLFALACVTCLVASVLHRKPSRACPSCGEETPMDGRRCRHCGYKLGRI